MKKSLLAAFAAPFLIVLVPATPVHAEDAIPAGMQDEAYDRLFRVFMDDPNNETAARAAEVTMDYIVSINPTYGEIERDNPGFLRAMENALLPIFARHMVRVRAIQQPRFVAGMRSLMNQAEARDLAVFLESGIGQRVLSLGRQHQQILASEEEILAGTAFTVEDSRRDAEASSDALMRALTPADMREIEEYMRANPVMAANMNRMRPLLLEVRHAMDVEPMLPADEAAIEKAMVGVLADYGYEMNPQ